MASRTRGSTGVVEWLSMKIGTLTAISLPLASMDAGDQNRLRAGLMSVVIAARALLDVVLRRLARATAFEIGQTGHEVLLELRQPLDLIARLRQARLENLVHALHRQRGDVALL